MIFYLSSLQLPPTATTSLHTSNCTPNLPQSFAVGPVKTHTHTRTPACWPSSSLPHHVLSEKENGDDFICLYLRLSKLHDNFPVGHIVYLLWAEENRRMWAAEQLMALMNQSVCTQDAWWKPYISKAGVHRGVWFCNKMQALSVRWLMNAPKL